MHAPIRKAPETRWQRWLRALLYGHDVDRNVKAKARLGLAIVGFAAIYGVIALRLVMFATVSDGHGARRSVGQDAVATARPDILDRNGQILATDVKTPSLFAEPRKIIDVDEAVELLTAAMPDLDVNEVRERLSSKRGFVWLKREITPKQQAEIHRLGIPGVGFLSENKRVYPNGPTVSHAIGHVNIDNQGIAGIEKWVDGQGLAALHLAGLATDRLQKPVTLAVDLRVQFALRDELAKAREKFNAKAAAGVITDVNTGEIIAMVSEPDYDPNNPREANDPTRINRLTTGVYEMGSTFKALTIAMALDSGKATLNSTFDARQSLRYGKFTIHDYHAEKRVLTVPEIFTYSSNIGAAQMALACGVEAHKAFLKKLGQLDRLRTELPESAEPLMPKHWGELNTVTIAFGHGMSVAPLQAVMGVAATINGGWLIPPTFLKRSEAEAKALCQAGAQARDQREDALSDAAQRREGHRHHGQRRGLLRRRQNRHRGKGHQRPLFQDQAADRFHGDPAGRQAALHAADHARRAAGDQGNPWLRHRRLERRADRGQGDCPDRAVARSGAALRSAQGRSADSGQGGHCFCVPLKRGAPAEGRRVGVTLIPPHLPACETA